MFSHPVLEEIALEVPGCWKISGGTLYIGLSALISLVRVLSGHFWLGGETGCTRLPTHIL